MTAIGRISFRGATGPRSEVARLPRVSRSARRLGVAHRKDLVATPPAPQSCGHEYSKRNLDDDCHGRGSWGFGLVAVGADEDPPNTGMADPVAVVTAFDRFAGGGDDGTLQVLSLSNLRGISSEPLNAGGRVSVDLTTGTVVSDVQLLPLDATFDLWLVDNQPAPGQTTLAEPADLLLRVGTYAVASGSHRLSVVLGPTAFTDFFPDRAFVVRAGENPISSFVLTGPSTTFARLLRRQVRFVDRRGRGARVRSHLRATRAADFAKLVAQGRQLFLKETFDGNGRTCGTCHVEAQQLHR